MKKLLLLAIFIFAGVSSWAINYETYNLVNERVLELKTELKKELHKKKYGNEVIGHYEIKGNKIYLGATMVERKGVPRQEKFEISEIRRSSDFKLSKNTKYNLPKIALDEVKRMNMAKALGSMLFLLGALFVSSLLIGKKKRKEKRQDSIYISKRKAA